MIVALQLGRVKGHPHTIRRARMSGPNARPAAKGWEAVVADLAERHADTPDRRVRELRQLVATLRSDA